MTTFSSYLPGRTNTYVWSNIQADDCPEAYLPPGTYAVEVNGTWGGASVSFLGSTVSPPSDPLTISDGTTAFSASANTGIILIGPIPSTYFKPKVTSGTGYTLSVTLSKVD